MSSINLNRVAGVFIGAGIGVSLVNLFLSGRTSVKKPAPRGSFTCGAYNKGSLRKYVAIDGEAIPLDESCDDVSGVLYVNKCMPETRVYNDPVSLWNGQSEYIVKYPLLSVLIGVNILLWSKLPVTFSVNRS